MAKIAYRAQSSDGRGGLRRAVFIIIDVKSDEEYTVLHATATATPGAHVSWDSSSQSEANDMVFATSYQNILALQATALEWETDAAVKAIDVLSEVIRKVTNTAIDMR